MPTLAKTWLEQGIQKGLQQDREAYARVLTQRFGALPSEVEQYGEQASQAQLDNWLDQVTSAKSLADIVVSFRTQ